MMAGKGKPTNLKRDESEKRKIANNFRSHVIAISYIFKLFFLLWFPPFFVQ